MERHPPRILRRSDIERDAVEYTQRLNPRSRFRGADLSRDAGLRRCAVSHARLAPGAESFALHAHHYEEEWLYVLAGRPTLLLENEQIQLEPGDYVAFPAPQVAHNLANHTDAPVDYLMGGETGKPLEIIDYPELKKSYVLRRQPGERTTFHELGAPTTPFERK